MAIKYKNKLGCSNSVKFNIKIQGRPTSVTLRKDIVSLWILLTDKKDPDVTLLVQEFMYDVVLELWEKYHGRGLSEYTAKCMIKSILSKRDYSLYLKIKKTLV
jgi:hypothetical protein